ncbi:hypothetical protein TrLO_g3938, partial [Triparma laevis f. longispina]
MKIYKNGALVGTKTDGHEPNVLTRTNHWLGRSAWAADGYFKGTIAYVKMWYGVELQQSDVTDLYSPHNTAHHFWDFRGCTTGGSVTDSIAGDLVATPVNGPICGADGLRLDGNNDYADINDWEWGGTTSFEVYVKYDSFNNWSYVFGFGNGASSDNVLLCNAWSTSTIRWDVHQGSTQKYLDTSNFDSSTWTHMVVTVSGNTMKVYKNGVLAGTKTDGHEPNVLTRTYRFVGAANWGGMGYYMDGTIAYVKMWHGVELQQSDVTDLYSPHNTAHHFWDFRGCTTGSPIIDSVAGDLTVTPMNGPICSSSGIALDGIDDYLNIDDWEWGGTMSIELYVKMDSSTNSYGRVFDFGTGDSDNVMLLNDATSVMIRWWVEQGSTHKQLTQGTFDLSDWSHIVVTVSGNTMKTYKNGVLAGTNAESWEPNVLTRTGHIIGANSAATGNFLDGSVMLLKIWHGVELDQHAVNEISLDPCPLGSGLSASFECADCQAGTYSDVNSPEACYQCPIGKYSEALKAESIGTCISCPVGKASPEFAAPSESDCLTCPAGKYAGGEGNSVCTDCVAGSYSEAGVGSCTVCEAGTWSEVGSAACNACPKGSYLSDDGTNAELHQAAGLCLTCPSGQYTGVEGSAGCTQCQLGKYLTGSLNVVDDHDSEADCLICAAGKYTEGEGSALCLSCAKGKFLTDDAGAASAHISEASCLTCATGHYSGVAHASCTACAAGKRLIDAATADESVACSICGSGRFSQVEAMADCEACKAGTYLSASGSAAGETSSADLHDSADDCSICHAGLYSDSGAGSCTPCTAGTFLNDEATTVSLHAGEESCLVCAAGSHSVEGSTACEDCQAGTFIEDDGSDAEEHDSVTDCKVCEAGSYSGVGEGGCTSCVGGKNLAVSDEPADHDSVEDCVDCLAGKFSTERSGLCIVCEAGMHSGVSSPECLECPLGKFSNLNSADCTSCAPGSFSNTTRTPNKCRECRAGEYGTAAGASSIDACSSCPAGKYSNSTGSSECVDCVLGKYNSFTCQMETSCLKCDQGFYNDEPGALTCKQCDPNHHTEMVGSVAYNECTAPPLAAEYTVVVSEQHKAEISLVMDQDGTGVCAFYQRTEPATFPTFASVEANGQAFTYLNAVAVTVTFESLSSSTLFDVYCLYTSKVYSDGKTVTTLAPSNEGAVTTTIGYAGYVESPCARKIHNTNVTLSLAARYNEGKAWVLLLPSPVDPNNLPTGEEIKAQGRMVGKTLSVDETGNAWLGDEESFCLSGDDSSSVDKESFVVKFTQDGLKPLTTYDIFIYTEDMETPAEALPRDYWLNDYPRTLTTTCCGFLSVEELSLPSDHAMSFQSYRAMSTDTDPIEFELSHVPGKSLSVDIVTEFYELESDAAQSDCSTSLIESKRNDGEVETLDSSELISPSSFAFQSGDERGTGSFLANFKRAGCVVLTLAISGESAVEYGASSNLNNIAVTVIRDDAEPTPPSLKMAIFADTVSSLFVTFNSPTDKGVKVLQSSVSDFACEEIFDIPSCGENGCMCSWLNTTTVKVELGASATTLVGSEVKVKAGKIVAHCEKPEVFDCDNWTPAQETTVLVSPPSVPFYPMPQLTGAETVSSCSDIAISATTSSGSGGRPWQNFEWSYVSTASNQTRIMAFMGDLDAEIQALMGTAAALSDFNKYLTLKIPNSNLIKSATYTFTLALTNFFGNVESSSLSVTLASNSVPTITVQGGNERSLL